jgi:16S rRNA (guanine527-N7)-methyltransferase
MNIMPNDMQLLTTFLPDLPPSQITLLSQYAQLMSDWNNKVNLVSRKDMEYFEERHLLHSLSVYKCGEIKEGFHVLDVGTGGGLPGIPLAITHPHSHFTLVDSIGKKVNATQDMVHQLQLKNVKVIHSRVEHIKGTFDLITGRAVTQLSDFYSLTAHLLSPTGKYIWLKGGDLQNEIKQFEKLSGYAAHHFSLHTYFPLPFFETKQMVRAKKSKR